MAGCNTEKMTRFLTIIVQTEEKHLLSFSNKSIDKGSSMTHTNNKDA